MTKMHGHGPVKIVMLHGWFGSAGAFDAMLPGLDNDRFSILVPDAAGYGSRVGEGGPFTMQRIADDALLAADRAGWGRFTVLGHSMGGKAALRMALSAPGRVDRLIGLTPVWAAPAPFDPETLAFFRSAVRSMEARAEIIDVSTGARLPSTWVHEFAERSLVASSEEAFAGYLESWAHDDFAAAAAEVSIETLIIVGAHDGGVPEMAVRATWAKLPAARILVLDQAGHYPMDECPLVLAATIAQFLDPKSGR